jgi:malonyl-CoA O-methyltransferase
MLQKLRVQRAFNQAAGRSAQQAQLPLEIAQRLITHFEFLKINPALILDLGAGSGLAQPALQQQFPKAHIVSVDFSWEQLHATASGGPHWWPWARRRATRLCADAESLPLRSASMGLVWSNLLLPYCDLAPVMREVLRILKPEGLFLFSTLGPDTLKEWRDCAESSEPHVFTDMHDIGDALVESGFSNPVMDRENLTTLYPDLKTIARDLKWAGGSAAATNRLQGLAGRARWDRFSASYEALRCAEGLPVTLEVVYGHAWKPAPRKTAQGKPIIELRPV